jgi:hypothetical protein
MDDFMVRYGLASCRFGGVGTRVRSYRLMARPAYPIRVLVSDILPPVSLNCELKDVLLRHVYAGVGGTRIGMMLTALWSGFVRG